MIYKILLIGAGQIGSRHLQALAKLNQKANVTVMDPSDDSLRVSKSRFEQMPPSDNVTVEYVKDFNNISKTFDICIVATTSDVRSTVLFELFKHSSVKFIILEKFLFQTIAEYHSIEKLFNNEKVVSWVNCPNRINPAYNIVKKSFANKQKISCFVQGGNWGLLCNSIHYFDFLSFLTDQYDYTFDLSGLDNNYTKSKREKFIEASGSIIGILPDGSQAVLYADTNSSANVVQNITGRDAQFVIDQTGSTIRSAFSSDGWKWKENPFKIAYQSELTNIIVEDILQKEICGLPTYEQSSNIHLRLLPVLLKHFKLNDYLPVT